jgi:hypothetical protein
MAAGIVDLSLWQITTYHQRARALFADARDTICGPAANTARQVEEDGHEEGSLSASGAVSVLTDVAASAKAFDARDVYAGEDSRSALTPLLHE